MVSAQCAFWLVIVAVLCVAVAFAAADLFKKDPDDEEWEVMEWTAPKQSVKRKSRTNRKRSKLRKGSEFRSRSGLQKQIGYK